MQTQTETLVEIEIRADPALDPEKIGILLHDVGRLLRDAGRLRRIGNLRGRVDAAESN